MKRVSKALGTLLGSITAGGLIALLAAFDVQLAEATAVAVVALLGTLGTYLAPPNAALDAPADAP